MEVAVTGDRLVAGATLATKAGESWPRPGQGRTVELWRALASLASHDLTMARVVEPHLDAHAILDQAGIPTAERPQGLLGVYAAEGPGVRVEATESESGWRLEGTKPWCSLAQLVAGFLVTAWVDDARRGLFLVEGGTPEVEVLETDWHARGLRAVHSPAVRLHGVAARSVGEPGWYLQRPGFAWGGMGVAAIWYGGAVGLARRLLVGGREPDQIALMHLGAVDAALHRCGVVLTQAAADIDAGAADGETGARLALRVRQVVREACEEVLQRVDHALGPAPLTGEEEHARRVADLHLYLRQEHAERDQAALGRMVWEHDR